MMNFKCVICNYHHLFFSFQWLSGKELIPKLVCLFSSSTSPEKQANAAQFICDVVKTIREQQSLLQDEKAPPNPLLEEIES